MAAHIIFPETKELCRAHIYASQAWGSLDYDYLQRDRAQNSDLHRNIPLWLVFWQKEQNDLQSRLIRLYFFCNTTATPMGLLPYRWREFSSAVRACGVVKSAGQ